MPSRRPSSVLAPLLVVGCMLAGCDPGKPRATAERGSTARTDSVPAERARGEATPEQAVPSRAADGPVGDPAPGPAPKQQAPQLPQLPFQLPTLPANLRLPFPLRQGLPTAPPRAPVAPKTPAPASAPQAIGASRVTVFGIPGCGACASLKSKLAARSIPYQYVDIDSAKQGTVPHEVYGKVPKTRVTQKNGSVTWVDGDDADKIERAYRGA